MLAATRLPGAAREPRPLDPAGAGQHVVDKIPVTGDVDDSDLGAIAERHPGETEVDRHLPLALFAQAVGMGAGQGFDERRLAVIDVSGRTHYPQQGCPREKPRRRGGRPSGRASAGAPPRPPIRAAWPAAPSVGAASNPPSGSSPAAPGSSFPPDASLPRPGAGAADCAPGSVRRDSV